jgi:hypothetical protein
MPGRATECLIRAVADHNTDEPESKSISGYHHGTSECSSYLSATYIQHAFPRDVLVYILRSNDGFSERSPVSSTPFSFVKSPLA